MEKIDLVKKVKALADKGIGGERANADVLLKNLMQKHGISEAALLEDALAEFTFMRPLKFHWLFRQVCASIVGLERSSWRFADRSRHAKEAMVECTQWEAIEIQARFDFYLEKFKADYEDFKAAFVFRNGLTPKDVARQASEASEEELKEYARRMRMAAGMSVHEFIKRIEAA